MPARISMNGLSKSAILGLANSEIYIAAATPRGTAMAIAPAVTSNEPNKRGSIPKRGGVEAGYHELPVMKPVKEIVSNNRYPSLKRKIQMKRRTTTVVAAAKNRPVSMPFSLSLL
jgi:hypothetical protein